MAASAVPLLLKNVLVVLVVLSIFSECDAIEASLGGVSPCSKQNEKKKLMKHISYDVCSTDDDKSSGTSMT